MGRALPSREKEGLALYLLRTNRGLKVHHHDHLRKYHGEVVPGWLQRAQHQVLENGQGLESDNKETEVSESERAHMAEKSNESPAQDESDDENVLPKGNYKQLDKGVTPLVVPNFHPATTTRVGRKIVPPACYQ